MKADFELYEGNAPYIFVSYCHKDKDSVLPVIESMAENGYRIWYDKGIHPGSEWPEIVAEHLEQCAVFLIFISDHYMQSQNCIREIHFAVARNKKMISVMMEPVRLTPGVEMQLCVSQALHYDQYSDKKMFYKDLYRAEALVGCKTVSPSEAPAKQAESRNPETDRKKKQEAIREPGKAPEKKKKKKMKKGRLILALAAAAVVVAAGAAAGWHAWNTVEIAGETYARNISGIHIEEKTVTMDLMAQLENLDAVSSLEFTNCTFEEGTLERLKNIETLSRLELTACSGITDCGFLKNLDKLFILEMNGCNLEDEAMDIGSSLPNLHYLNLSGNPGLTDVAWLEYMPELRSLELDDNSIEDMSPAASLENLTVLSLENNRITEISEPLKALRLEYLNLSGNQIRDLSGLDNLTVLIEFYLADNHYRQGEGEQESAPEQIPVCIGESSNTLEKADLSGNGFTREDLNRMLSDCGKLTYLDIGESSKVESLDFLRNCTMLETLYADSCGLTGWNGPQNMEKLKDLDLSGNELESLEDFPVLSAENGVKLDLRNNRLTSLEGLDTGIAYDKLILYDNILSAEDTDRTLEGMQGNVLGITYEEGLSPESLQGFDSCYIAQVPDNRKVAWEDALGYKCRFEIFPHQ